MKSEYINAIEHRLHWLKWSEGAGESTWRRLGYSKAMPFYRHLLETADTFYMAPHFSRLVDHARQQTPDDLKFDLTWVQAQTGFLWLDEPFICPTMAPGPDVKAAMDAVNAELDTINAELRDPANNRAMIQGRIKRLEQEFIINKRNLDMLHRVQQEWKVALDKAQERVANGAPVEQVEAALSEVRAASARWPGVDVYVRAIGWNVAEAGTMVYDEWGGGGERLTAKSVYVACFQDFASYNPGKEGFGCWSYFTIRDGEALGARVTRFETKQGTGKYEDTGQHPHHYHPPGIDPAELPAWQYAHDPANRIDRRQHPLHEIRWVYTAMYLMARRLAITVQHATDRATQRRAQREGQEAPPFIRVITLRRLEAAREREAPNVVDWQWQWEVRGHWRNQFFPSEGLHKPVFIEAFIKGPSDKPLKPGVLKLFAAER